nr:uncharacterized protein LOC115257527 [Aedes albopictus]
MYVLGLSLDLTLYYFPADCIHDDSSDRLLVRTGNYDLKSTNGYQEHHVAKKVIHPDFNKAFNTDNIALLFLRERSGTNHPMACIFDPNEAFNDRDCLAVGWNNLHFLGTGTSSIEPNKQHISILRSPTVLYAHSALLEGTSPTKAVTGCMAQR